MSRARGLRCLSAVLAVVMLAACGGDDDASDGDEPEITGEAAQSATTADGGDESGGDETPTGSGPSADRCPLTADQVSEVLGTTVEREASGTSCSFFPPNNAAPRAILVRLPALACTEEYRESTGQEYAPYDALEVEAYATMDSAPASIIVCSDDPFDINVDISTDAAASLAAATELATIVLEAD